jgi:ribonuclease Z
MGRKTPLHLYAPAPADELIARHLKDFDINLAYGLEVHTISGKSVRHLLDDKRLDVYSFPLKHRVKSYGFLFREKMADRNIIREEIAGHNLSISEIGRLKKGEDITREGGEVILCNEVTVMAHQPVSYAFCSDTGWFPKLSSYVRGVDLLYHEATFGDDNEELAMKTGHSTARQAAAVARDAGVGRLILGHFSARYRSPAMLEEEARQVFPLSEAAREGSIYDIS